MGEKRSKLKDNNYKNSKLSPVSVRRQLNAGKMEGFLLMLCVRAKSKVLLKLPARAKSKVLLELYVRAKGKVSGGEVIIS